MMKTLPLQTQDQIKERLASHIKNYEFDGCPGVVKEEWKNLKEGWQIQEEVRKQPEINPLVIIRGRRNEAW